MVTTAITYNIVSNEPAPGNGIMYPVGVDTHDQAVFPRATSCQYLSALIFYLLPCLPPPGFRYSQDQHTAKHSDRHAPFRPPGFILPISMLYLWLSLTPPSSPPSLFIEAIQLHDPTGFSGNDLTKRSMGDSFPWIDHVVLLYSDQVCTYHTEGEVNLKSRPPSLFLFRDWGIGGCDRRELEETERF